MPSTFIGELILRLQDNMSGKAKKAAADVNSAMKSIEANAKRLGSVPWGVGFQRQMDKLGMSARELHTVRSSWDQLQRSIGSKGLNNALKKSEIGTWKVATLQHFAQVRAAARSTEQSIRRMASGVHTAMKPLYVALGGYTGFYMAGLGVRFAAKAASERERELFRQDTAGISPAEQAKIRGKSEELGGQYKSVPITDIMEMGRISRNLMGDADRGVGVMENMVKAMVALQSVKGVDAAVSELTGLLRGLDNLGANKNGQEGVDLVNRLIGAAVKASQIEGNEFDVGKMWEFARRSKVAGPAFGEEFLATVAPALIQDMGAAQAGNAASMAYKALVIGASDNASKVNRQEQARLGLKPSAAVGAPLVDADLFGTNPYEWVKKHLIPSLQQDGIDTSNPVAVAQSVAKITRNTNAAGFLTRMITQQQQIDRNIGQYRGAMGIDAAKEAGTRDPFVAWAGLKGSLENLAAATVPIDKIAAGLDWLSSAINSFAKSFQDSNSWVKTGTLGAAGAAGAYGVYSLGAAIYGLTTAGVNLNAAAVSLEAAAASLAGGGVAGDIVGSKKGGKLGKLGKFIGLGAVAGVAYAVGEKIAHDLSPEGQAETRARHGRWNKNWEANKDTPMANPNLGMNVLAEAEDRLQPKLKSGPTHRFSRGSARSGLDLGGAVQESKRAGAEIEKNLSVSATPQVDSSMIDRAIEKAKTLLNLLRQSGSAAAGANSSVDSAMRRNFPDFGVSQ